MQWLILAALAVALATALWACWRQPTIALVLAIASMALVPGALAGLAQIRPVFGWSHGLLVAALGLGLLRNGIRVGPSWPVVAIVLAAAASVALGDDDPGVGFWVILSGLGLLLLPWLVPHVVVRPGSRQLIATAIALTPPLSLLLGLAFGTGLERYDWGLGLPGLDFRVVGATGDAGLMAMLAFVGFAVAVHDASERGRPLAAALAVVDLGLVVATGDRPILLVTGIFLFVYLRAAPEQRSTLLRQWRVLALTAIAVLAGLALARTALGTMWVPGGIAGIGRAGLWPFFWEQFQISPWFGRGIGAQTVLGAAQLPTLRPTPHNTFLGFLVDVGAIGTLLIVVGIGHWCRWLWRATVSHDRALVGAMVPALTILAALDDLLLWPAALSIFVYFGVLCGREVTQRDRVPAPSPPLAPAPSSEPPAVPTPAGDVPEPVSANQPPTAIAPPRSITAEQLASVRRLAGDDLHAWAGGPKPRTTPPESPVPGRPPSRSSS